MTVQSSLLSVPDELLRLQTLENLQLHEVLGHETLQRLARAAAGVVGVPTALVTLVGEMEIWSQVHTEEPVKLPRDVGFCNHTIRTHDLLVVSDAQLDPRFAGNPLVTGPRGLRFYVGMPIALNGQRLGALCVIDSQPRTLTNSQREQLENLGALVNHWLQVRRDYLAHRSELLSCASELERRVSTRTQELEVARSRAEQASAAKSAFLATMSHEIRTPMNGVLGMLELLERTPIDSNQRELCQTMHESAQILLGLIDNVLDFAKIEAGHLELHESATDLRALVEGSCEGLLAYSISHDVWLHTFVDPALPSQILCDPLRLRQLLTNLVGNAIKFSTGQARAGQVMVRVARSSEGDLLIEVQDTGIGIAPEQLARLFQPFQQADSDTTRRYGGSGLGLVICRRLVKAMNGDIELKSTLGEGTVVRVHLPLQRDTGAGDYSMRETQLPAGMRWVWHGEQPEQARDWVSYLNAAGVLPLADEEESAFTTVHLSVGLDTPVPEVKGHRIRLIRDAGRHPQIQSDGALHLSVDVLRRDALLEAVRLSIDPPFQHADLHTTPAHGTPPLLTWISDKPAPVLVAEDNAVNRQVIKRQLQQLGISAVLADDGAQALALWEQHEGRFSLVLTDLHMPVLDGYQLTKALRSAHPPASCPVIALTANAMRGEASRCKLAGMQDYLSKPLSLSALGQVLTRWMPKTPTEHHIALADFDPQVLVDMLGDEPEDHRTVLDMLLKSLDLAQAEIEGHSAGNRWQNVAEAAHRLKSSARASGARYLGELLHRVETAGRRGDASLVWELLPQLAPAIERLRAESVVAR